MSRFKCLNGAYVNVDSKYTDLIKEYSELAGTQVQANMFQFMKTKKGGRRK